MQLPNYSDSGNETTITSGSWNKILSPIYIRLLFDRPGTIGNILGFKNVGDINSITNYSYVIKNIDLYENDTVLDETGLNNLNINFRNLELIGDSYILIASSIFKNSVIVNNVSNVFAKLFLWDEPGSIIYNDFIQ